MTPYEYTALNAVECTKLVKGYSDIAKFFPAIYWLSEFYSQTKEMERIENIQSSRKLVYWTEVCMAAPERPKLIKILAARACYAYDFIVQYYKNQTYDSL